MSATAFVFIGYLLLAALTPLPFDLKFFGLLIILSVVVDVFNLAIKLFGRGVKE